MKIFQVLEKGYEEITYCYEPSLDLRLIIAIHNTKLGPAVGGLRLWSYASENAMLQDALKLSAAMTYKAAAAGLNLGGGKAVANFRPSFPREAILKAIGKFVNRLNGSYYTAEDVGTTVEDMVCIRTATPFVLGLPESMKGSGDPSIITAYGVLNGIKACLAEAYGDIDLNGKIVAIQGVGKVGFALAKFLHKKGAKLIVTDIDKEKAKKAVELFGARYVAPTKIHAVECDLFSPCALGGAANKETIKEFKCKIVAGAANNVLADENCGRMLQQRNILFAPDFIINAGGLINVSFELSGYSREKAMKKTEEIYDTLRECFSIAKKESILPHEAAKVIAEKRLDGNATKKNI